MGKTNLDNAAFPSVYEFCGGDGDIYLEILIEIRLSVENLLSTLKQSEYDLDGIKFIVHKMKSTFRILNDDTFRQTLDDFTQHLEDGDNDGTDNTSRVLIGICNDYETNLSEEIESLS